MNEVYKMSFAPVPKPEKKAKTKKQGPSKIERPAGSTKPPKHLQRDEFELEELASSLNEAKEQKSVKVFTIYMQNEPLKGIVTKMDPNTKLIHITDSKFNVNPIHFLDILKINSVE